MPVYKHSITEVEEELSADYVSAFPSDTWKKVKDEGPYEKQQRELREAIENKVDVEDDDGNVVVPDDEKKGK